MEFFKKPLGKTVAVVVLVGAAALLIYKIFLSGSQSEAARQFNTVWMVCSETGKAYQLDLSNVGEFPTYSPASKKNTGYPAELCYWNADGTTRTEPTKVLLNSRIDKPEPTFCPDCGRLVVGRNPAPGSRPPPTEAEYKNSHHVDSEAR